MSKQFNNSDLGNAQRFAAMHGNSARFCYPWGKWLAYDGRRWRVDESGEVERLAKSTIKAMYSEALTLPDDQRAALTKHALETERRAARIAAMIDLARSELGIAVQPEQLDCDPWLLNVQNGTIDLRSGKLRPHDRADLATKIAPVSYDPEATCERWEMFLHSIFAGKASLIDYVKRLLGYSLTGDVREQILGIFWGSGSNGKSTLLNLFMSDLLGPDYALKAPHELLMVKGDEHPTERADLYGKRLVAAIETDDGKRLAESLVKELTGGDAIRARRMRENFWEFRPTHKLVLCTNHKPSIRGPIMQSGDGFA